MEDLVPYKPAHPNAPKAGRAAKGIQPDKSYTNRTKKKCLVAQLVHNRFRSATGSKRKDKELTSILKAFNENVAKAAVSHRAGVTLPNRMGKSQVLTFEFSDRKVVDDRTSSLLGVELHYNRLKGGGKCPHVTLNVYGDSFNMPNKLLWEFVASKPFKDLAQEVFDLNRTYFEPAKKEYLAYYRKDKYYKKEYAKKQGAELLLTYNEFEGII